MVLVLACVVVDVRSLQLPQPRLGRGRRRGQSTVGGHPTLGRGRKERQADANNQSGKADSAKGREKQSLSDRETDRERDG